MNTHSSKDTTPSTQRAWMLTGVGIFFAGILLFATITLSAVGIMLMILGLGVMMASFIRAQR